MFVDEIPLKDISAVNLHAKNNSKIEITVEESVYVDAITSGKLENGIFAFLYKGRMIDNDLFRIKPRSNYYAYKHHWDRDNIENLAANYPQIFFV